MSRKSDDSLPVLRCASCNKIIAQAKIIEGKVKIVCKCGTANIIEIMPEPRPKGISPVRK